VNDNRVLFFDVKDGHDVSRNNSRCNEREAQVIAKIVNRFHYRKSENVSIGIISFYSQQGLGRQFS
jgi:superfamily I DNA and/or RNA helicase